MKILEISGVPYSSQLFKYTLSDICTGLCDMVRTKCKLYIHGTCLA